MRLTESQKDKIMMLLCVGFGLLLILYVVIEKVNGQTFEPLRYEPTINEDQVIVCVKDVTDSEYRGQLYCGEYQAENQTLRDIQQDLYKNPFIDTFEMGLID